RIRKIKSTAICSQPHIAGWVLGECRDVAGTYCARCSRLEWPLHDTAVYAIEHIGTAAVSPDPDSPVARRIQTHYPGGTESPFATRLHRERRETALPREAGQPA